MPEYRAHWRGENGVEAGFQRDGFGEIEVVPWAETPESCGSYSTSFLSLEHSGVVYTRTIGTPPSEWSNGIPVPEISVGWGLIILGAILMGIAKWRGRG